MATILIFENSLEILVKTADILPQGNKRQQYQFRVRSPTDLSNWALAFSQLENIGSFRRFKSSQDFRNVTNASQPAILNANKHLENGKTEKSVDKASHDCVELKSVCLSEMLNEQHHFPQTEVLEDHNTQRTGAQIDFLAHKNISLIEEAEDTNMTEEALTNAIDISPLEAKPKNEPMPKEIVNFSDKVKTSSSSSFPHKTNCTKNLMYNKSVTRIETPIVSLLVSSPHSANLNHIKQPVDMTYTPKAR